MKSFLATILLNILLISNGMLTAVIDVCCLNEDPSIVQNDDCCSNHTQPKAKSCCDISLDEERKIGTHEGCEFDFWYYYTPKFIEEKSQKNPSLAVSFLYKHQTSLHTITAIEFLTESVNTNYKHAPPVQGRKKLEYNCTWLI